MVSAHHPTSLGGMCTRSRVALGGNQHGALKREGSRLPRLLKELLALGMYQDVVHHAIQGAHLKTYCNDCLLRPCIVHNIRWYRQRHTLYCVALRCATLCCATNLTSYYVASYMLMP